MPDDLPTEQTGLGSTDVSADGEVGRRGFIGMGMGAVGACYAAGLLYPVYRYLATPARRAAALGTVTEITLKEADKLPAGSAMMFRFGARPAMLIHHKDGAWAAFSAVCTHLGCTVSFEADAERIYCACHGGVYDSHTGKNVSGPPPKPLPPFSVEVRDGEVLIARV